MINFRLSYKTELLLKNNKGTRLSKKQSAYYNSQKFFQRRPDLAPRNLYLRMGRILDMKTVRKRIDSIGKETFSDKCSRWIKKFNDFIRCR